MVMVNLGSTDDSRYTGYREITDRDVLDLQCMSKNKNDGIKRNDPFKVQTIEISDDFNTAIDKAFCFFQQYYLGIHYKNTSIQIY